MPAGNGVNCGDCTELKQGKCNGDRFNMFML